ncbi:hypothetical protein CT19431_U20013 [Cupriavidus taiwanensis]|nr:hypothetical protein CT19431_U20013 [Cupriavidus taiwanensis]
MAGFVSMGFVTLPRDTLHKRESSVLGRLTGS